MTLFLDTNICIYALKGMYPSIARRLRKLTPEDVKIASIVRAELRFGAHKSHEPKTTLEILDAFLFPFEVIPFGAREADAYGEIRATLARKGAPIGPNDLILAATVLAAEGTLVTHNTKEFRRVKGLRCEDWVPRPRR